MNKNETKDISSEKNINGAEQTKKDGDTLVPIFGPGEDFVIIGDEKFNIDDLPSGGLYGGADF